MRRGKSPVKYQPKQAMVLASLLLNLQLRRVSFSLQLLKQFYLFPDQSDSSQKTVSKYDCLIFSDEQIHTMFKKLQTKLIQFKIWGFLNLKYYRIRLAIQKMEPPIQAIQRRTQQTLKAHTFLQIKTYSQIAARQINMNIERELTITVPPQPKSNKQVSPKKETTKPQRGSQNKIEINIDIRHHGQCGSHRQEAPSPTTRVRQSSIHHRSPNSKIRSQTQLEYESVNVAYPISQLHPSSPKVAIEDRSNRFREGEGERGRSRSGSIIRYQLDLEGAKKKVINGKEVPVYVKLKRTERTPEQPEYTVVYEPSTIAQTKTSAIARSELQKKENLRYQYQDVHPRKQNQTGSRMRVTPSKINSRNTEPSENSLICPRCNVKHAHGVICTPQKPSQKIIRLRSSSKNEGYLQHLHS